MAYNKKEVLQANTEAIRVVLRLEKISAKPPKLKKVSYETIRASVA